MTYLNAIPGNAPGAGRKRLADPPIKPLLGLALLGALGFLAAMITQDGAFRAGLLAFSIVVLIFAILICVILGVKFYWRRLAIDLLFSWAENEDVVCFLTGPDGELLEQNQAADEKFGMLPRRGLGTHAQVDLSQRFEDFFAQPAAVLYRVQSKAHALGRVVEDLTTREGKFRLSATSIENRYTIWRLEVVEAEPEDMAGIANLPATSATMVTDSGGRIIQTNQVFKEIFGDHALTISDVFAESPVVSGRIHRLRDQSPAQHALVTETAHRGGGRQYVLMPCSAPQGPTNLITQWDVIEDLPVPLLKVNEDGQISSSNQEARNLLGSAIPSGTRMSDVLRGLGRPLSDWVAEASASGMPTKPQFLEIVNGSAATHAQISLIPTGGETRGVIAVLRDVTEFKNLELQFVQSQKMQAIGQLAGGVAHDFNNLLTAISGHCDLLLLRHDPSDGDYADLVQIHQNTNRAASLVGQLLAYSRKQNLRPEVLNLRDTLSNSTHLLNRLVGERITLTLDHDPELHSIHADERQLEQVLMNLVVNARDAMPEGGEIRIETENVTLTEQLHRDRVTVPAGDYVVLRVHDTGTGIGEDIRAKIFEPFWTTKAPGEGTGLGLSTAYGIVKQTGGYIFVDSTLGVGTTFRILIPRYEQKRLPQKRPATHADVVPAVHGGVILLVEDEASVRAFTSRALKLRGFTVIEADCAEMALALLEDQNLKVDLFLTDVIMPGEDGPSWVRKALAARPETKVIFMSGYAEEDFGEAQRTIPNSVFMPKPFSLSELTAMVSRQLGEISPSKSAREGHKSAASGGQLR